MKPRSPFVTVTGYAAATLDGPLDWTEAAGLDLLSPRSTGGIAEFTMASLVLASRAARLQPPSTHHPPRQLSAVNNGFSPTAAELAWARAVIAAWDDPSRTDRGAITVAGQLIDEPIIRRARQLLDR